MTDSRTDATAICVLGMHRSGTSAVTGVLHALGAFLGPAAHLMKAREDNPAGFFEHQLLTDLNDELLHALGGSWVEPPMLDDGWERAPRLDGIRERARQRLREDFADAPLWVWKDPRTCLTLPFWLPLLPRTRYVVCLRNPLDVARSLQARDGLDEAAGVDLWMQYTVAALTNCPETPLLVDYDDVLTGPSEVVARLAAMLERDVPHAAIANAHAHLAASRGLRHHRATLSESCATPAASFAAVAFYGALQRWAELARAAGGPAADDDALVRPLAGRAARAHAVERNAERVSRRLAQAEAALEARDRQLTEQSGALEARTRELAGLAAVVAAREEELAGLAAGLAAREAELTRARGDVEKLDGWLREAFAVRARLDAALVACDTEAAALHAHIAADAARRAELEGQVQRTAAEHAAAAAEVARLNGLLLYLQTPGGIAKLAARALLPAAVHKTLRAWGTRVVRGSSKR